MFDRCVLLQMMRVRRVYLPVGALGIVHPKDCKNIDFTGTQKNAVRPHFLREFLARFFP